MRVEMSAAAATKVEEKAVMIAAFSSGEEYGATAYCSWTMHMPSTETFARRTGIEKYRCSSSPALTSQRNSPANKALPSIEREAACCPVAPGTNG